MTAVELHPFDNPGELSLPVSETFITMQGEGPRAGRPVQFIRLGGCNLACTWCDTPYTWDASRFNLSQENPRITVDALMESIEPGLDVVISGGEPLIHQARPVWATLLRRLHVAQCQIAIETNGTIAPDPVTKTYVAHYSVSPKLAHAGKHRKGQNPALSPDWPQDIKYRPTTALKFVVRDAADVQAAYDIGISHGWPAWSIWVMPEGIESDVVLARWREISEEAIRLRINATQRLHVLAWGALRGV